MKYKTAVVACALALLPAVGQSAEPAPAQPAPAQSAPRQPAPILYGAPITLDAAERVAQAALGDARKNTYYIAVVVIDSGGNPVLIERMDGTQLASVELAQAKAVEALHYRRSTRIFRDSIAKGGDENRFLTFSKIIASEGGEILMGDGKIIGAIGISGSPSDQQAASAGVAALNAVPAKK